MGARQTVLHLASVRANEGFHAAEIGVLAGLVGRSPHRKGDWACIVGTEAGLVAVGLPKHGEAYGFHVVAGDQIKWSAVAGQWVSVADATGVRVGIAKPGMGSPELVDSVVEYLLRYFPDGAR